MQFNFFKNQHLEHYKIELIHEIFSSNSFRPELKELYIPQKLMRYESLLSDCDKVFKRIINNLSQLQMGEKLWIIGKPESGKSTLLKKIALRLAFDKKSDTIPVYLNLEQLWQSKRALLDFIIKIFAERDYPQPDKFIYKNLAAGKLVFLADALDEISHQQEIREVLRLVKEFLEHYSQSGNTFLIACRTAQYCNYLNGLGKVYLADLNEKQMEGLIQSRLSWPTNPYQLLEELKNDIQLKRLSRSPFGFSRICYLFQNGKSLPRNRAELYQIFIRHNLELSANPFGRISYNLKLKSQILEASAFYLQEQGKIYFSEDEFRQILQKFRPEQKISLQEAQDLLKETYAPAGLLMLAKNRNLYRFTHLSLQENLAAQNLNNRPDGLKYLLGKHQDNWWRECIVHFAGLQNNASNLINCLNEINVDLALNCFAEAQQVYPELQRSMQKYLQRNLDRDCGGNFHLDAYNQAVIAKADGRTVNFLKAKIYKSPEIWRKIKCAQLLCEIGDERSLNLIEGCLQNGTDAETKKAVVSAFDHLWSHHQPLPSSITNPQLLELAGKSLSAIEGKN
ncbi:MAG: NACHT domain-containing protein [Candidatus Schekmanbacteria bacterium]|nr:NACHT domain-containing protein [Candidatus Schekmanbacteria bacterium]